MHAAEPDLGPRTLEELFNSYRWTEPMEAAIELGLFAAIREGYQTAPSLSSRCGTSERGMRILCDYLVVIGFLTKLDGCYGLTAQASGFLAAAAVPFAPRPSNAAPNLAAVVRKGGSLMGDEGTLAAGHPIWAEYARFSAGAMAQPAESIARLVGAASGQKWKVLDVAAGHGLFGIAVARLNPKAEIVAVDWPDVLAIAQETAQIAGVADRYHALGGNAFEVDFGTGYDLVLLTNILHLFDEPTCECLLRKVHAALKRGGRATVLDFIPNEDRVSPPIPASFSLMMLISTPGGDAYTFSQHARMLRHAGFGSIELHPLPPTPEMVVMACA